MATTSDPTGLVTHSDRLSARAAELSYVEMAALLERTETSKAMYERAVEHLPLGVPSSFQAGDPYPIYVERGQGAKVWDVDDNEYLDFHGGFGVGIAGHAHPKIVEAVTLAVQTGTHFAAPTPVTVDLAEEICRRFELDKVRFANSGTEATMDAIRVARAATGRDVVVKIEGSYHGHHDTVMFSVLPNADALGGRRHAHHHAHVGRHPGRHGQVHPGGAVQRRRRLRGAAQPSGATRSPASSSSR